MFALIDCNNFYASCERVFRPDLYQKPIIVLSNNDGCVIARSNEAKLIGIKMGVPYFKIQALCQKHHVHVFSSNFALYGDLSARVMTSIELSWPDMEIYSIDEAFLNLSTMPPQHREAFCRQLQKNIYQWTGVPTSIGLGATKTLAKVANYIAKKELSTPVFSFDDTSDWLNRIAIADVWGIGRQWSKQLNDYNIFTAQDLVNSLPFIKRKFNINLIRTALELSGERCLELETPQLKKSIVASSSFGEKQTSLVALQEAVSFHCAKAWQKLRKQQSRARYLTVFISANHFRADLPQYANSVSVQLLHPSDDLRVLTKYSLSSLAKIFKTGFFYRKCGIMLTDLVNKQYQQLDLFTNESQNSARLMEAIEEINSKYGASTIHLAAEGLTKKWAMKQRRKTPSYTTRWNDIPIAYAK